MDQHMRALGPLGIGVPINAVVVEPIVQHFLRRLEGERAVVVLRGRVGQSGGKVLFGKVLLGGVFSFIVVAQYPPPSFSGPAANQRLGARSATVRPGEGPHQFVDIPVVVECMIVLVTYCT